ncbi:DUF115 domain-containing protein [Epibacterium ulvae]|uniref:6-hydroxymethylpterin diphosphokinase MptE-like protein n=1 Tax=Epibacterium ulvae TaxID=1156985 RepID=UPI001BFC2EC9|nr:6-hydroxymethylpterin diphosphokinase MptE-like protein [Epibacterium ulvae]MBT8154530.1 DUF115 domain-containing protein [Epibacterium ulvae]
MLARGMHYRLQSIRAEGGPEADAFNLSFWRDASHLAFFGVELLVVQGAVTLSLRHCRPDGQEHEIARIDCPYPGSSFSPPLDLIELANQGGSLVPVIVNRSEDAKFDACFGTNDLAPCPNAHAVFVSEDPQDRTGLRDICHNLAYGLGPTVRSNDDDMPLVPTHLALSRRTAPEPQECRIRTQALACFLRQNVVLHGSGKPQEWPVALFDLRHVYSHGLPTAELSSYMSRFADQGVVRLAPFGPPPRVPTWRRQTARRERLRLGLRAARTPSPEIVRIKLEQIDQTRHLHRQLIQSQRQMEQRLRDTNLWDPAQIEADLTRASRTALSLLRNRHQGQRAVVVGNGPSLRPSDLERLRDVVTFGSNKIFLAYDDTDWRPNYYSVEDHLVLMNNRDRIAALSGSIKLFPASTRNFDYHAGDTIFAPFLPPKSFEDPLSDPEFPHFSHDLSQGIAWGSTITYSQIQMAAFMGCAEIILIGVDHSYRLPSQKRGNQYIYEGEQNHFHPDYRSPGEAWHQPNLDVLERSYAKARDVCAARGIRIMNASRQSKLDVFERADFDQMFPPTGEPL